MRALDVPRLNLAKPESVLPRVLSGDLSLEPVNLQNIAAGRTRLATSTTADAKPTGSFASLLIHLSDL